VSGMDRHLCALIPFAIHGDACAKRSDKWADCTCGLDALLVAICQTHGDEGIRATHIKEHWYTDFAEFADAGGGWRRRLQEAP